jgi:uncharacterized membrane protein YGL010W
MKTLEEQMSFYAAYHQDARNKATHFIGVPLIMLAILVPLSWLRIDLAGFGITAAMLLAAAVLAYYFVLDVPLALAMLVVIGVLMWLAERIAALGAAEGRPCLRGPQARPGRQPVPDLRRAYLPRRGGLSRPRLEEGFT